MLQTSLWLMKSLNKTETPIFLSVVCFQRQSFLRLFYYTAAGIGAVWWRWNVSLYFTIVQIRFHFLWDHWAHCGVFENGVLLMYVLEGVSSVANFITTYEESQ